MKRLFKILSIILAIVLGLLVAASVALRIFLPPEKAKALVLKHLSEQLRREVEVGSVSVGVFSGLQISKLKISESPTFAKGTFLSSELFTLQVALLPLLSKQVIVRQAVLKEPTVTILRMADGKTFNFSDLTKTVQPTPPGQKSTDAGANKPSEKGTPFVFVVSHAEIARGALHFVDRSPAKQSVDIEPFDLKLKGVSLTDPFSLKMGLRVKYRGSDLGIRLGGKANLKESSFHISEGSLSSGAAHVTVSGLLSQLQSAQPVFKLHLQTNDVPIQDLLRFVPSALPKGVVLDGTTRLAVDLSGTTDTQQFASKWTGTGLRIAKGEDFQKPVGVPLELTLLGDRAASGAIQLKMMNAKISNNTLAGSGTYEPRGQDAQIHFSFKGVGWSVQDLATMSPAIVPFQPSGTLSFDGRATGRLSAPQTSLHTAAKIKLGKIQHPYYEGQGLEMDWDLSNVTPELSKVSGLVHLTQGPGKILQLDKLAASSRAGKIALLPLESLAKLQKKGVLQQVNLPSLQSIPFDSIVGDYALKNGDMEIKRFDLVGQDLSVQTRGHVGLAGAQPVQMKVALKLAPDAVGGTLGALIRDETGRPTVKFTASGTLSDPKVKWDLDDTGKKALQQAGQELMKNKDVQKAVDDIQNTLKGIFR